MCVRIPRIQNEPNTQKKSKVSTDPVNFNKLNPCWQIGNIDYEGFWGYSNKSEKIYFEINQDLTDLINDDANCDIAIGNALLELDHKEYNNIEDFFGKLHSNSSIEIPNIVVKAVTKCIQRHFFIKRILPKLKEFERLTWYEIETLLSKNEKTRHHSISVLDCSPRAQKRLRELKLNDVEEIFSFRLEWDLRVIGLKKLNYLQILWIDENHEVCPGK